MGFIKTIFIILILYYSARIIFRILVPFLIHYFFKKAQNQSFKNYHNRNQHQTKVGEVHVSKSKNKSSSQSNVGEYIDFEEVEEND